MKDGSLWTALLTCGGPGKSTFLAISLKKNVCKCQHSSRVQIYEQVHVCWYQSIDISIGSENQFPNQQNRKFLVIAVRGNCNKTQKSIVIDHHLAFFLILNEFVVSIKSKRFQVSGEKKRQKRNIDKNEGFLRQMMCRDLSIGQLIVNAAGGKNRWKQMEPLNMMT